MLVGAVAAFSTLPFTQRVSVSGAPRRNADHDRVGAHGLQRERGVFQLSPWTRSSARREVDHVGRESLGGELEADPGSGRVLVEQVHHGRPRSAGTFLMTLVPTSRNDSAVSRIRTISSALTSWIDSRCPFTLAPLPSLLAHHPFDHGNASSPSTSRRATRTSSSLRSARSCPRSRRGSQLAVPPVDEHRQLDRGRAPEVHEGVQRRADRPAREQDVVDQHDGPPVDVEVDPGLVDLGRLGPDPDVVPVEGDVQRSDGDGPTLDPADLRRQPPREVVAAGGDPPRTTPSAPLLRSTISCAMRVIDRAPRPRPSASWPASGGPGGHQEGTPGRACGGASWSRTHRLRLPSRPLGTGLKGGSSGRG